MREILFRGKTDKGEWVEGLLWKKKHDTSKFFISYFPDKDDNECVEVVLPETIGQYTGLTTNGKKIFEGDILKFDYIGRNRGVNGIASVVFENGKFCVLWGGHKNYVCLDGFANTSIEVVGNIHDNPELLKGGEG